MIQVFYSKNKYNENSTIAEIFTQYGKVSGIVFGGPQKKLTTIFKLAINYRLSF